MERSEMMQRVIEQYQQDEGTMIRLFVKWCLANDLDPNAVYAAAYPEQQRNAALADAIKEDDGEPVEIGSSTMIELLQLFGNDDLAIAVSTEAEKLERKEAPGD